MKIVDFSNQNYQTPSTSPHSRLAEATIATFTLIIPLIALFLIAAN